MISKRSTSYIYITTLIITGLVSPISQPVYADMSTWDKGASITPISPTDFASASSDQSLTDLSKLHANSVNLIILFNQPDIHSSALISSYNTPTDESLIHAIKKAHALGMKVILKFHVDSLTGEWRAHIDPTNRDSWFTHYNLILTHYALLAQENNVEGMIVGTELIELSSDTYNVTNTAHWKDLIKNIRALYTGSLTYAANWGTGLADEKNQIAFWDDLDYAGIDAYYPLGTDNTETSPSAYMTYWDDWNTNDISQFEQRIHKPIVFTEVGYKSASGSHIDPGNYKIGDTPNPQEQAHAYQALFSYWSPVSFIRGIYIWEWQTSPTAGGIENTDYTPQGKPAEAVISTWYSGAGVPTLLEKTLAPEVTASSSIGVLSALPNHTIPFTFTLSNTGGDLSHAIVDVEIHDHKGIKVYQQFFENQSFASHTSAKYPLAWSTPNLGAYTVSVGVFNASWSTLYTWTANLVSLQVENSPLVVQPVFSVQATSTPQIIGSQTNKPLTVTVRDTGDPSTDTITDIEIYNSANQQVFQRVYDGQSFVTNETKQYEINWQSQQPDTYRVAVGVFAHDWTPNYIWNDSIATIVFQNQITPVFSEPTTTPVLSLPTTPVTTSPATTTLVLKNISVWWPTTDSTIGGTIPFKALVDDTSVDSFDMYWQVDGGAQQWMYSTPTDYPHKEAWVDVSGWNWRGNGPYVLTFTAKSKDGNNTVIAQKDIRVTISR